MDAASFVPFVGSPVPIAMVAAAALVMFDDWIPVAASAALTLMRPAGERALAMEPPLASVPRQMLRRRRVAAK